MLDVALCSLAYGYTPNGDRSREDLTPPSGGSALTTLLNYPATSNRLASTSVGSFTTRSFTYDAAGNLLTQVMGPLRLTFAYNQRNRPVSLTRTGDGTQTSAYLFNALEQLVRRRTNAPGGPAGTVQYLYGLDGELLVEADAATGQTLRDYIWLPQGDISPAADNDNEEGAEPPPLPLAVVTGANTGTPALLMVHADHLNRPTRLTDATRATVWQASYDPFGQPVSITGPVEQNLRFPGQYFLIESGLSYNWHRFYDPVNGRYTQPDPLRFVDGPSVYGYAGASPLMWVDPEGLQEIWLPPPEFFARPPPVCPPLEEFPLDPTKPPGPGWEWGGKGEPGKGPGNWYHPDHGSLGNDMDHPPPIGPHLDWKPPGRGPGYRWFPDGRLEQKKQRVLPPIKRSPGYGYIAGWYP